MQEALYYPFTRPNRESFLKTALFLWDSVDFIVPFTEFRPHGNSKEEEAALELIGRSYVPTNKDKKDAHKELEKICESNVSDRFRFELEDLQNQYDFYPQKLLPETWQMLSESRLAQITATEQDVKNASTGPLFGYYMMTILAICCCQNRKRMVTDQLDSYRVLANLLADDPPAGTSEDWHGRLISLTLKGPNFANVPLRRLIDLRAKESQLMSEMRRQFLKAVDEAAVDITANADNPNIVRDRIQSFTHSMEQDLSELKRALLRSTASVILSKEFGFSIFTAISSSAAPILGTFGAVAGLSKSLLDYQDRRRELLKKHTSAWLFSAENPNFSLI